jgi:membrane fusion protein, copper/silver efflux system
MNSFKTFKTRNSAVLWTGFVIAGVLAFACMPKPNAQNTPMKDSAHAHEHVHQQTVSQHTDHGSQYYCPMHPQVKSDKPGVCPICQMELVLRGNEEGMGVETAGTDSANGANPETTLRLDPRAQVLANVRTVRAVRGSIEQTVQATGILQVAESAERAITARVSGRVERLFVRQTGVLVRNGQALFELYSPDLIQAQSDFLLVLKSLAQTTLQEQTLQGMPSSSLHGTLTSAGMSSFAGKARERLALLGMTAGQIATLERTREVQTRITIHAPFGGTVMQKNIIEGASVSEGVTLYALADLSTVWNVVSVPEANAQSLRAGMRVNMRLTANPSEEFPGRVAWIAPIVNAESRTINVRIEAANKSGKLRPGAFTETELTASSVEGILVPEDAVVFSSSTEAIVWVQDADKRTFHARRVRVGAKANGKYHILDGISEGENVVERGGFLLDSERQLRAQ